MLELLEFMQCHRGSICMRIKLCWEWKIHVNRHFEPHTRTMVNVKPHKVEATHSLDVEETT